MLDQPRFVDLPPIPIYATLLDEGTYLCSISTMYRILAEHTQLVERRRIARHPARVVPELVATAPGQVYSWDITELAGPAKGVYYDAYVMIDIYSRYIVGVRVHPARVRAARRADDAAGVRAARRSAGRARRQGYLDDVEDRRPAARRPRGHPVPLPTPGVERQPLLRGLVQTLKYAPEFPERFGSPVDAQQFLNLSSTATTTTTATPASVCTPPPTSTTATPPLLRSNAKRPSPPPAAPILNVSAPNAAPRSSTDPAVWTNQPLQQAAA